MSDELLELSFRRLFESEKLSDNINIVWHAGEPLAVPLEFYEKACQFAEKYRPDHIKIIHTFQTNGIPLTQAWCDFIREIDAKIGISIDGPKFINDLNRVNRKGLGTFEKTLKGIELLKKNGIDFSVIAVLTEKSLEFPDELLDFFSGIGATSVGFNVDEVENKHNTSSLGDAEAKIKYQRFMRRVFEKVIHNPSAYPKIRELDIARSRIAAIANDVSGYKHQESKSYAIVAVDYLGNFSTFSPELLGENTEQYGKWIFGNIMENTIDEMADNDAFKKVLHDIRQGEKNCKKECDFHSVCGGGSPSNKLGEKNSLLATATDFCELTVKNTIEAALQAHRL